MSEIQKVSHDDNNFDKRSLKLAIRLELNEFKLKEMKVHDQSRSNTLFYDIGKYHTRLRDHFSPKKSFLK